MSDVIDNIEKIEELSRLLDELNNGREAASDDKDVDELVTLASLIKNAAINAEPPQHIINDTVACIAADFAARRQKRLRTWLFSGLAGTAASILLIIGLNLHAAWFNAATNPAPAVQVQDTVLVPQEAAPPVAALPPAPQTDNAGSVAAPPEQPAGSAEASRATPLPVAADKPAATPRMAKVFEAAPDENAQPAAERKYTAKAMVDFAADKITPLSIPGKKADSLLVDGDTGTVCQVFNKGTAGEFVVTQQIKNKTAAPAARAAGALSAKSGPDEINKVTVIINGQEVTVEGRMSREELMRIAKTLTLLADKAG